MLQWKMSDYTYEVWKWGHFIMTTAFNKSGIKLKENNVVFMEDLKNKSEEKSLCWGKKTCMLLDWKII